MLLSLLCVAILPMLCRPATGAAGTFCTDKNANLHLGANGELVMDHDQLQACPKVKWPLTNNIGVAGAKALANELKINTKLHWLWLYNNAVEQEGAEVGCCSCSCSCSCWCFCCRVVETRWCSLHVAHGGEKRETRGERVDDDAGPRLGSPP